MLFRSTWMDFQSEGKWISKPMTQPHKGSSSKRTMQAVDAHYQVLKILSEGFTVIGDFE